MEASLQLNSCFGLKVFASDIFSELILANGNNFETLIEDDLFDNDVDGGDVKLAGVIWRWEVALSYFQPFIFVNHNRVLLYENRELEARLEVELANEKKIIRMRKEDYEETSRKL
ncbi:hypothetical protein L6452_35112 [Arctium lappa]|uniref:Uncharacterized protein n=1 Tax=Arctium lappa TaxID=4217 RepID=A0ACB8YK60_ARCLA|nr:hypothetical protein L6452_35112 [Arctium lappa]